ncbi:hypothetical protein QQF64_012185 [Cirrhinus molitorella]|uniref:Uncharacterized protein n=1 Tax=Cirrhinus molitorella TaxID=172907 RepID=A0ABR3LUQ2_9TELE
MDDNSRTRGRRIKVRVQPHLLSLAMEALEQAEKAVDQEVQNIKEDGKDNAEEAVNLDFDVDTAFDFLYMNSDPDEDFCSENHEEEPHNNA